MSSEKKSHEARLPSAASPNAALHEAGLPSAASHEAGSSKVRLPSAIPRDAGSREAASREAIIKEIAKTSKSICQKYRALKTGKMEEDVELKRHFKPITEPLR